MSSQRNKGRGCVCEVGCCAGTNGYMCETIFTDTHLQSWRPVSMFGGQTQHAHTCICFSVSSQCSFVSSHYRNLLPLSPFLSLFPSHVFMARFMTTLSSSHPSLPFLCLASPSLPNHAILQVKGAVESLLAATIFLSSLCVFGLFVYVCMCVHAYVHVCIFVFAASVMQIYSKDMSKI